MSWAELCRKGINTKICAVDRGVLRIVLSTVGVAGADRGPVTVLVLPEYGKGVSANG